MFKFLSLGVLVIAFYAISATSVLAQTSLEDCNTIYERFKVERTGKDIPQWTAAIASGKEYLDKCSNLDPPQEEVKTYVTGQIPKLQQKIADKTIADKEARFNAALKANNADEIVASAKDLINTNRSYSLDLMLDIASVGYDKATTNPAVDKFNGDAINFAKMALQKMSEGQASGNADNYGFYVSYKNKDCADGKVNAIGWMNYTIGVITSVRLKQTKDAVPYFYKASQVGCGTKNLAETYRFIGAWYLDETIKLNVSYAEKTKAAGDKDTDETLAILAMIKGYADRGADAYARAYKIATAPTSKALQPYKDSLLKRVKDLYDVRFGENASADAAKFDSFVAQVPGKPFVDPTTPVNPIVEAAPTAGPTTSTGGGKLTGSGSDAQAATTTRATSATGTGTGSAPVATTAPAKKAPAKKPAKKKGTR